MSTESLSTDKESPAEATTASAPADPMAHWKIGVFLFVVFLALDHLTKWWAIVALRPDWWGMESITMEMWMSRPTITLIPGLLRLAYAENLGAAFSIMYGQVFLLGIVSLVATVALCFYWRSLPSTEQFGRAAVALVLSGAVGNMIDRFFRGRVIDFIDAHWFYQAHWPTFNIADSCICVGATVLIIRFLQGKI